MAVQVAFYRGDDAWIHRAIRWVTRSPVSHCEIVLHGQGYTPKRGHRTLYQRDPAEYAQDWILIDVPWSAEAVRYFLAAHPRMVYDLRSLLAHLLPIHDSLLAQNCAEFVVNLASYCGDPRFHNRPAWRYAPGDIYHVLRGR